MSWMYFLALLPAGLAYALFNRASRLENHASIKEFNGALADARELGSLPATDVAASVGPLDQRIAERRDACEKLRSRAKWSYLYSGIAFGVAIGWMLMVLFRQQLIRLLES